MAKGDFKNKFLPFIMSAFGGYLGHKYVQGAEKSRGADDMAKMPTDEWKKRMGFQDYTTPQSYTDELGLRKTQARQEMPGFSQQRQDINAATASTLSGAQNLGGTDSAAITIAAGEQRLRALRNLGIAASQYGERQREGYTQAVGRGAQFENQAFDYNTWLPQQMKLNLQQGLGTAGEDQMSQATDMGVGMLFQGANLANIGQMGQGQQQQGYNPYQGGGMNPAWQGPQYNYGQNQWGPSNNNQYPYNFNTGQYTPRIY